MSLIEPIKKARIPDEIAARIKELILEGAFEPGAPLPSERVLAQQFGVSRGSVRDAFRKLEMLGLLEARHGSGTFPQKLSVDNLVAPLASVLTYNRDLQDELFDARRMFEPAVARVAAARIRPEEVDELQRIVDAQRQRAKAGQSIIAEDTAFHSTLARATHNAVVIRVMDTLNDLLLGSRRLALRRKGRPLRSVAGHEKVIAALRAGDAQAAAEAMHQHIDEIAALVMSNDAANDGKPRG